MNAKRNLEVFSTSCPVCEETIAMVNRLACSSCEITVLNMNDRDVAARAPSERLTDAGRPQPPFIRATPGTAVGEYPVDRHGRCRK